MELASTTYEVLGKNKDETIRIKLSLSSVPDVKWTIIFNNHANKIRSVKNTSTLILEDVAENINQINIVGSVQELIRLVDAEISENTMKESILVENNIPKFKKGMVLTHDSLPYDASIVDLNHPDRIVNYSQFLSKINNNQIL